MMPSNLNAQFPTLNKLLQARYFQDWKVQGLHETTCDNRKLNNQNLAGRLIIEHQTNHFLKLPKLNNL